MAMSDEAPRIEDLIRAQQQDRDEANFPSMSEEDARLIEAFRRIQNPAMRETIIEFVEKLADNQNWSIVASACRPGPAAVPWDRA
jgi:hypothetical protein